MNGSIGAISPAQASQAAAIAALLNKAYRGEEAKKGWTTEADLISGEQRTDEQEVRSLINAEDSWFFVYTSDNVIVGCLHAHKEDNKLYLGMLSVDPSLQARGIGKQLLRYAEDFARSHHFSACKMLVIDVRQELIDYYIRQGYINTGERHPFPDDHKSGIPRTALWFTTLEKDL